MRNFRKIRCILSGNLINIAVNPQANRYVVLFILYNILKGLGTGESLKIELHTCYNYRHNNCGVCIVLHCIEALQLQNAIARNTEDNHT